MNDGLKTLINKTMELEGLLLLAQSRQQSGVDAALRCLILDKQAEVSGLVNECFAASATHEAATDFFAEDAVPEPVEMPEPVFQPIPEPENEPEPEPEVEIREDYPDEEDALLDEEYADEEDDDDDADEELLEDEEGALTLDEALQRSMSRDLRKAFSLNDRFRFRRELFGNSDVEMTEALNLVETMGSLAEAEEFFYGDKEWDRESPEVKDFMEVIKKHFLSVRS